MHGPVAVINRVVRDGDGLPLGIEYNGGTVANFGGRVPERADSVLAWAMDQARAGNDPVGTVKISVE